MILIYVIKMLLPLRVTANCVLCILIHVNFGNVLLVAFSIPSGSLSLVKYSV
jgi:hypothetical protein